MISNKAKVFFYPGNTLSGKSNYGLAKIFMRSAEVSANVAYKMYLF